jgi:hypothetical protein
VIVNTLSLVVPFILMAFTGVSPEFAAKRCNSPESAPALEELIHQTADQPSGGQKDSKTEIAKLRAEVASLRVELESALKEINRLKDAIGQGAASKDQGPVFRGKPARFWLDQVKDGDPKFRAEAIEALGSLAEKNKKLIPVLVTALEDKDYFVRAAAPKALASLGPEVVPMLLVVLKNKTSPNAVEGAADAIRGIGPKAKAAVPLLTEALKMDDWGVRRSCVTALGQIGPDAKPAIPAMVEVLGGILKTVGNDAKQGKSAKPGVFGIQGLPFAVVDALVKIDPEVRKNLPEGILTIGFSSRGPEMEQFQQAHAALKKKYDKAK